MKIQPTDKHNSQIVISFISSANGPLQPTKQIQYPDIRVGIPSMLLCIEMAIFAVMHIFAFPWKPYSIKHSYANPLNEPGTGFGGGSELRYLGVFTALVDAFNPWDIVKMTARGFRWLFVGVRKRHDDISYHQDPDFAKPGVGGANYAPVGVGAPGANLELRAGKEADGSRGRSQTIEDDRARLLHHQAQPGRGPSLSPYRPYEGASAAHHAAYTAYSRSDAGDSQIDLGAPPYPASGLGIVESSAAHFDSKPSDFDDEYTSYHPGQGPNAGAGRADAGGAVHPARRADGSDWPLSNDARSLGVPPSYDGRERTR